MDCRVRVTSVIPARWNRGRVGPDAHSRAQADVGLRENLPAGMRLSPGCPHFDLALGERLKGILGKKGTQTSGVCIAWIWVEDYTESTP
jgi:hypothetical protein